MPAGALLYVISISLVIGLLLSFFILFISYKKLYREQLVISSNLLRNAESGINLLQSDKTLAQYEAETLDLFGTGKDSVTLKQIPWGIFNVLVSTATFKNKQEQLIALAGPGINAEDKTALYLADLDRPVSVSGDTKLKGICYLPKAGIKSAFVEGSSFTGSKMVDGVTKNSTPMLPALDEAWLANLLQLSKRDFTVPGLERIAIPLDSLKQSFAKPTQIIEQEGTITLSHIKLEGNIIITSSRKVIIESDCQLKDVMIVAPYIRIKEDFAGQANFVASDSILVDKKVKLRYPSSLVVVRESAKNVTPFVSVDEDAEICGVLMCWQKEFDFRFLPKLMLAKNTFTKGQIYSNGYVGLNSSNIFGSVYAYKLLLATGSAVYENHLLNTTIDGTRLPLQFAGISFKDQQNMNSLAKWLY